MVDPIIEEVSFKATGKKNKQSEQHWSDIRDKSPEVFAAFQAKFALYPAGKMIPKKDLIKIQNEISFAIKTKAASEAFGMLKSAAVITKSPELAKAAEFSKLSIDCAVQIKVIHDIMKNSEKIPLAELSTALVNPTLALATIGLQIFSSFMKSGPSIEEIMLKQMQMISQQIADLHHDMLTQFGEVHKHLKLIHESLYKCAEEIKFLIVNQVSGFRSDANDRLKKISSTLTTIAHLIIGSHYDMYIKSLQDLATKVAARLAEDETNNEKVEVAALANDLHAWITSHSSSQGLNGMRLFKSGNNFDAHNNDVNYLENNAPALSGMIGYMVLLAQESGLNLDVDGTEPAISTAHIIRPEVYNIAATEYTKLRRMFPTFVDDNELGDKYTSVISAADNTINFIKRVQKSEVLFENLFNNYKLALTEAQHALLLRSETAKNEFQSEFKTNVVDLRSDYATLMSRAVNRLPKKFNAVNGTICEHIEPDWLPSTELVLPPEIFIAQELKLAEVEGDFSANVTAHFSDSDICAGRIARNGAEPPHSYTSVMDFSLTRQRLGDLSLAQARTRRSEYDEHQTRHRGIVKNDQDLRRYQFDLTFNVRFMGLFTRTFQMGANKTFLEFVKACGVTDYTQELQQKFTIKFLLTQLKLLTAHHSPDDVVAISQIADAIKSTLVSQRKSKIATPLVNGDDASFNNAMLHLESAKRRLQAFAILAGFPGKLLRKIDNLSGEAKIKAELKAYIAHGGFLSPYWREQDVARLSKDCKNAIVNNKSIPKFNSKVLDEIKSTTSMVSLHRMMYVTTRNNPNSKVRSAQDKALDLGISLTDLKTKYAAFPVIASLVRAIIDGEHIKFKFIFNPLRPINLQDALFSRDDLLTAFHLAAYLGNADVLKELLARNSNVNAWDLTTDDGLTPLMFAVKGGDLEAVKLIQAIGVNLLSENIEGNTAEDLAQDLGFTEIYNFLKSKREPAPAMAAAAAVPMF